uniref:methyl-accepting chemotaxis protein n=1 Tax=Cucumibacter marinus TaxID=1121252 RepID=UPI000688591E
MASLLFGKKPLMSRLSLRTMLFMLALVPLAALTAFGINQASTHYRHFTELQQAIAVQRVANAGSMLAIALPGEDMAPEAEWPDQRANTDARFAELFDAYDALVAMGMGDSTMTAAVDTIRAGHDKIPPYRAKKDNGTANPDESLFILQPISAAGLSLTRRAGAMIDDLELARFIDGFHALMQVNDAGLIEFNLGSKLIATGPLGSAEFAYVQHAKDLRDLYGPPMREYLPGEITKPITDFPDTQPGRILGEVHQAMFANVNDGDIGYSVADWEAAAGVKIGLVGEAIAKTSTALDQLAASKLAEARTALWQNIAFSVGSIILIGALCLAVIRALSRAMRGLSARMIALTEGDSQSAIPHEERKDEIGEMARALQVFRENAIEIESMNAVKEDERQRDRAARQMSDDMQAEVARVVRAAANGDFSARITREFEDDNLNAVAHSLNDLMASVQSGLAESGDVLAALAQTDLTHRVEGDFKGAFLKLKNDTNAVADRLTDVVAQLRDTSRALKTATGEILSGANDLSERTTKQAATIEETSAAMENIAATVLENVKEAQDASEGAENVRVTAETGGQVMQQATEAMERITNSSAKISNIIGMIDDIAFQTNLLALNASVEAA